MAKDRFDVIVVGSGATGGWAAKELTERGLRVALLEAGPMLFGADAEEPPRRRAGRQPVQEHCFSFDETTAPLFVDDVDNPYSHPDGAPFDWIRSRQVGGRLLLWDRVCLRMSDLDLKAGGRDGVGNDWPISYADLSPYYDQVERFLGVTGSAAGCGAVPDGEFAVPPPLSAGELRLKQAVEERWPSWRMTDARVAQAPPDALLNAAMRTGRLTLLTNAIASRVITAAAGDRADGVAYVDARSGAERKVEGDAVFLCASTIESTRLLLNSATDAQPNGLGNSSGVLGHYLMDHTLNIGFDGLAPDFPRGMPDPESHGCLIPNPREGKTSEELGYVRRFAIALAIEPRRPRFLKRLRNGGRGYGGWLWLRALGEVLPRYENRVTIDPHTVDAWGIPIARIECEYGENERLMAADQLRCVTEIAAAGRLRPRIFNDELAPPGRSIHEMGTARMGNDPATSFLDPYNRSWEVPNLFVTDGSCFVSGGWQNPTLTMMAITVRACEHYARSLNDDGDTEPRPR
jgi:choline dehydrogenase-like flavoprotein